ncbi:SagB family peptide dehydrogenase [Sinorhizobium meliloti]|uniref:SagB family peptide dehydrogenase n=1 Tax=Rhizobium meliloti TaxID=382 RepID=UPI0013E3BDCD|nr:SagB family peptide dehydrogenase [Sinorhizobium meliloti]
MSDEVQFSARSRLLPAVDLTRRHSSRDFFNVPIDMESLGSILYAAQGHDNIRRKRLIPSAGSSYPLRMRVAAQNVSSLTSGLYLYEPDRHVLITIEEASSPLSEIASAAFDAPWIGQASAALLVSAEFERTTVPYAHQPPDGRAEHYVWLEAGHAAQNVALATATLSLATVFVGGFHDDLMSKAFRLASHEHPIGVMPVGHGPQIPELSHKP